MYLLRPGNPEGPMPSDAARKGRRKGVRHMGATRVATGRMPMGLPCGRRVPHGRLRWYLARVPEGRESATCEKLRRIVSAEVLDDVFALRKERWFKRGGAWSLQSVPLYAGYLFVATRDVAALDRELAKLSFPVQLVGADGHAWAPLAEEAREWFETSMDDTYTLRNSVAEIAGGELHVQRGPLVGQESRVRKIDRHKRVCLVSVCDADGGFVEPMPIDVPVKG